MKQLKFTVLALAVTAFTACKKDEMVTIPSGLSIKSNETIFVINEGNFTKANGSIGIYDKKKGTYIADVFKTANGITVGDVPYSITSQGAYHYIVVNNSGKVHYVDTTNFKLEGTITGLISPRIFRVINDSKAYITDLYAKSISIIDLKTNSISGTIPTTAGTEDAILANGKVYIAGYDGKILVVNTITDKIEKEIPVSHGATKLVLDKNSKLWVLCENDWSKGNTPSIEQVDLVGDSVIKKISFPSSSFYPSKLIINSTKDELLYINNGIFKLSINATSLNTTALIDGFYYGLSIDPKTNELYIADAKDFSGKGEVVVYDYNGIKKKTFGAGIIPAGFAFY